MLLFLFLFLPLALGYEVYPCDLLNTSHDCHQLGYCSWCSNETYEFCNEYPICYKNEDFNCTRNGAHEICGFFDLTYFILVFIFFFLLTYAVGASLISVTYFGTNGEKKFKPIVKLVSATVFISGICIYYYSRNYLSYYIATVISALVLLYIIYYVNRNKQRALIQLGSMYAPLNNSSVPPPYEQNEASILINDNDSE